MDGFTSHEKYKSTSIYLAGQSTCQFHVSTGSAFACRISGVSVDYWSGPIWAETDKGKSKGKGSRRSFDYVWRKERAKLRSG
jgi:hypothetical protein